MKNEETEPGFSLMMSLIKSIDDYILRHKSKFDKKVWSAIATLVLHFSDLYDKTQSEPLFRHLMNIDPKGMRHYAVSLTSAMIDYYNRQDFESAIAKAERLLNVPSSNSDEQSKAAKIFAICKQKLGCERFVQSTNWAVKLKEYKAYRSIASLNSSRIQLAQKLLQNEEIEVTTKVYLLIEMAWIKFINEEFEDGLIYCRQAFEENIPENSTLKAMLHLWTGKTLIRFC